MNEKIMFSASVYYIQGDFSYIISGYAKDEEEAYDMVLEQINQEYEVIEYMDCF